MTQQPTACFQDAAPAADRLRFRIAPEAMATIIIFGATGDLTARKLMPAIYNLWATGFLPERIAVVGVARRNKSDSEFRRDMCEALKKHSRTGHGQDDSCEPFICNLFYHSHDFSAASSLADLDQRVKEIERSMGLSGRRLYYLATGPEFFTPIVKRLGKAGLIRSPEDPVWTRVVIEKPFGHDLASAQALNRELGTVLAESQTYRIDHYLGKETVQNIFAFRFGNAIFEPLFNQKYVDHVQITVAESVGMEGRRGAFYDKTGALRDVIQNHGLQLLSLVAMEPPASFTAREIRNEKVKVLNCVSLHQGEPLASWCVRGQYTAGPGAAGYLEEEGVAPESVTETYVALHLHIDNWRWAGVPFYIRTGKRLAKRLTEIAVQFKDPPMHFFESLGVPMPEPNVLAFRIQPDEAISLTCSAKPPGMDFQIRPVNMDFHYGESFQEALPEAYERLLLDALRGDSTLFMRADEIESAWSIITDIRHLWDNAPPPELYPAGTWGPPSSGLLFQSARGCWRNP